MTYPIDWEKMWSLRQDVRRAGARRFFALLMPGGSLCWFHAQCEEVMQEHLAARGWSEERCFISATAILVVDPELSEAEIRRIIHAREERIGDGPGYFAESFV